MADYSTLLRDHVTLACRSIDRIFLQAYAPKLQTVGWVCSFLRGQRGYAIPSSAAFGRIGDAHVAEVHRFAEQHGIPVVHFAKGECKEEVARPFLAKAEAEGGDGRVALIGIAQEKAPVWRSWRAKGQEHAGHPHMEWGRQMAFINHFYFYLWDPEWGAAFWKTNAYAPYPIWIWLSWRGNAGHSGITRTFCELQAVIDASPDGLWCWAAQAADALREMKDLVDAALAEDGTLATLDAARLAQARHLFHSAALVGANDTKPRSTRLMAKHHALARRLIDRQDDYLRFTVDPRVRGSASTTTPRNARSK